MGFGDNNDADEVMTTKAHTYKPRPLLVDLDRLLGCAATGSEAKGQLPLSPSTETAEPALHV